MLPHFTDVALHEEASSIICEICRKDRINFVVVFGANFWIFVERRRTGIVIEAADATDGFVFLLNFIFSISHLDCLGPCRVSFSIFALPARSASASERILGCDCVF